jgi:hypothetical protein
VTYRALDTNCVALHIKYSIRKAVPDAPVVEAAHRFAAELAPLHLDVEVAVTAVRAALRHQAANRPDDVSGPRPVPSGR